MTDLEKLFSSDHLTELALHYVTAEGNRYPNRKPQADAWVQKVKELEEDRAFYRKVYRQWQKANPVGQHARWDALSKAVRRLLDEEGRKLEELKRLGDEFRKTSR